MKTICEITDRDVLGTDGRASAPPRYTARAIVINRDGLYAVMYAEKFNLYSLPGGGIEAGEDALTALRREILEETGCSCDEISELGAVLENRAHCNYTQCSFYYIVRANSVPAAPCLTEGEKRNRTMVCWRRFDEVVDLITSPRHDTNQRKFLQARDRAALMEYCRVSSVESCMILQKSCADS